jgi:hypothetical protein
MKKWLQYIGSGLLAMFGCLTLFLSSSIIFDWFGIREKEGNYLLFIVWTNFICSMLYLASAFGMIRQKMWTVKLLVLALVALGVAYVGLFVHINAGGLHETKTIGAMAFRIVVTAGFAGLGHFVIRKEPASSA